MDKLTSLRNRIIISVIAVSVAALLEVWAILGIILPCKRVQNAGFSYEIGSCVSPTLTIIEFYHANERGETTIGPVISGNMLYVQCRDIDWDGVAEFIIISYGNEENEAVLSVNIQTGKYHVVSVKGLKISFDEEGYYFL